MTAQGTAEFRVPPPIPKLIDAAKAIDKLPSYDSVEPAPDDLEIPLPRLRDGGCAYRRLLFATLLPHLCYP